LKNLSLHILVRVTLIVVLSVAFGFVALNRQMLFVPVVVVIVIVVLTADLIRYIYKTNTDLTRMLLSVREGAFTDLSKKNSSKPHPLLDDAINEITKEFAKVNLEKELHYQYLKALNENIHVAILSFDNGNKLLMMNPEAKHLLKVQTLLRLDDLRNIDSSLYHAASSIKPGDRQLIKIFIDEEQIQLSIQVKHLVIEGNSIRILLLQNISNELESKEIEAWQSLTQVLTHEIMNSVTPISSLTTAIQSLITYDDGTPKPLMEVGKDSEADIHSGISTIAHRTKGLLRFIRSYKEFAKAVELRMEQVDLTKMIDRIANLLAPDIEKHSIKLGMVFASRPLYATADLGLIEQVLINLIKNAMDAVPADGKGIIQIAVKDVSKETVAVSVSDNGSGMDEETRSRIFIPFYTTKPNGTGIGLSLSRKIMRLHGGTIKVQSEPGKGSVFTMEWRR
jgi:two-component system, NtrC family, nitrogen regulation sensor histidine kinase NtrY